MRKGCKVVDLKIDTLDVGRAHSQRRTVCQKLGSDLGPLAAENQRTTGKKYAEPT